MEGGHAGRAPALNHDCPSGLRQGVGAHLSPTYLPLSLLYCSSRPLWLALMLMIWGEGAGRGGCRQWAGWGLTAWGTPKLAIGSSGKSRALDSYLAAVARFWEFAAGAAGPAARRVQLRNSGPATLPGAT